MTDPCQQNPVRDQMRHRHPLWVREIWVKSDEIWLKLLILTWRALCVSPPPPPPLLPICADWGEERARFGRSSIPPSLPPSSLSLDFFLVSSLISTELRLRQSRYCYCSWASVRASYCLRWRRLWVLRGKCRWTARLFSPPPPPPLPPPPVRAQTRYVTLPQSSPPLLPRSLTVTVNEKFNHSYVPSICSLMQRSYPMFITQIEISTAFNE